MAQGTRKRWLRLAATGFGVVLCTGLVGCMNNDKPKDTKTNTPQAKGLPGTPTLPAGTGAGAVGRTGQPTSTFAGPGSNLVQPAGGFGTGAGAAPVRTGMNNLTTTGGPSQPINYGTPGAPGIINAPAQTGYGTAVQPAGGFGSASQYPVAPGGAGGIASPPPPPFDMPPLPPGPPPVGGASSGIVPPPSPLGPIEPSAPLTGKGPPLGSTGYGSN